VTEARQPGRQRQTLDVTAAPGGWPTPWPNVEELAAVLPTERWTLVGGLMTQVHSVHRGLGVVRPTNDVDIVLHIETARGTPAATAAALESIGYRLQTVVDPRSNTAHRFTRSERHVDIVTSGPRDRDMSIDTVDVLTADHPAPRVEETLLGRRMVKIQGGTQALRRTINACLEISPGTLTTLSIPGPLGALILKAAAYTSDTRDRDRHLFDAAALLACIADPLVDRDSFAGSDRRRVATLTRALPTDHPAWRQLPRNIADDAQAALRLLATHQ